jgi:hypothetical protein
MVTEEPVLEIERTPDLNGMISPPSKPVQYTPSLATNSFVCGLEVLTAVNVKSKVFRAVTPCA